MTAKAFRPLIRGFFFYSIMTTTNNAIEFSSPHSGILFLYFEVVVRGDDYGFRPLIRGFFFNHHKIFYKRGSDRGVFVPSLGDSFLIICFISDNKRGI